MEKTLKVFILIALLTVTVTADITIEEATDTALKYKEPAETIDLQPKHKVTVSSEEYWPIEINKLGEMHFIIPIDSQTGKVTEKSVWAPVMKIHYLANFFSTNDEVTSYLDSAKTFGQEKQTTFSNGKDELEFYEGQMNVTLTAMDPLQNALQEGIDKAEELRSDSITASTAVASINQLNDVTGSFNKIQEVFSTEQALIDKGKEVNEKANDLDQEVAEARTNGEIQDSIATPLIQITNGIEASYIQREDTLTENEITVNNFYNSLDSTVSDFEARLDKRMNMSKEEQEINQVENKLNEYSKNLGNISNTSNNLPSSYLENEDFEEIYEETSELITESQQKCTSTENVSKCLEAKLIYSEIEDNIEEMKQIVNGYTPCTEGETKSCTVNGQEGFRECINGQWTSCQVVSAPSTLNWPLIGSLLAVLVILIVYKYKDQLFGAPEPKEKEEGGGQYEEFWK